jgi:ribonuclease D
MSWRLNSKQLNSLKYLARWRFQQAKLRDMPIGFIAKDHTLIALAQGNPDNLKSMSNLEGAEALDIRHKGKAMLAVLDLANKVGEGEYPAKIMRIDEYPSYKQSFKKLKAFFIDVSRQYNLPLENLASKKQINQFLTWHFDLNQARSQEQKVELLSGWRNELFGQQLQNVANNNFE